MTRRPALAGVMDKLVVIYPEDFDIPEDYLI